MPYKLVVLHGWGQSREYWQQFITSFSPTASALDLPGFGSTPLISSDWGIPQYADWVSKKLRAEKGDIILLAHSFGGRIATYIASQNPSWLKALILYGSPSIYRPSFQTQAKIATAKLFKKFGVKSKTANLELAEADSSGLGKIFRKVVNFDQTHLLKKVTVPTLLVWGEFDREVPLTIAKEMQLLIPQSKLVVLEGLGHNAHLENPHLFYGSIKTFLDNL